MHPILLEIGSYSVSTYSVLLGIAFVLGTHWSIYRGRNYNISSDFLLTLSGILFVSGILGAKLFYFFLVPSNESFSWSGILSLSHHAGGIFLGGFLLALGSGVIYVYARKYSLPLIAKIVGPPILVGIILGRLGCFFNGCCYGIPVDCGGFLAFHYSNAYSLAYEAQMKLGAACLWGAPLWSGGVLLVLVLIVLSVEKFFPQQNWSWEICLGGYFLQRTVVQFWRMDEPKILIGEGWLRLDINQWICLLGLFILLIYVILRLVFRKG